MESQFAVQQLLPAFQQESTIERCVQDFIQGRRENKIQIPSDVDGNLF